MSLLRLELGLLRRDRAVLGVLAGFMVVVIGAAWLSGRHTRAHVEALSAVLSGHESATAAALAAMPTPDAPLSADDPRDPATVGRTLGAIAMLPPGAFPSVSAGLRASRPQALKVSTGPLEATTLTATAPMRAPSREASGPFDPAFVFVVLFPLVAIALSYDLLSGERERGTLALLLSQPVTQGQLVAGKAAARGGVLVLAGVLTAGVGALVSGDSLLAPIGAAYVLGIVLYGLFWFALAVAVNARGWGSAQNALVLVGAWLALVVIVPGLLRAWVEASHPPPSRVELVNETREAAEEAEAELGAIEGRHGGAVQGATQRAAAVQEELAKRTEPVVTAFRAQRDAQQAAVERYQVLSPAIVLQELLNDIAGTGAHRQQHFEAQIDAFHRTWRATLVPMIAAGRTLGPADYHALPRFEYQPEPDGALWRRALGALATLLAPSVLLALLALPGLRRVGRLA